MNDIQMHLEAIYEAKRCNRPVTIIYASHADSINLDRLPENR